MTVSSEYFFLPDLPKCFAYTVPVSQYIKGNFVWLVKTVDDKAFFHYTRMPSGRLLCKWVAIPG